MANPVGERDERSERLTRIVGGIQAQLEQLKPLDRLAVAVATFGLVVTDIVDDQQIPLFDGIVAGLREQILSGELNR